MRRDSDATLLSELRWFVSQRWLAGIIVVMVSLLNMYLVHWIPIEMPLLFIGIGILLYNCIFWCILRVSPRWLRVLVLQRAFAWAQIVLDLSALSVLTGLTNGLSSPVLGLFMLHMIFASLLLHSPQYAPYGVWALAVGMMTVALWLSGQWPETTSEALVGVGWMVTLFLTIYFATHITGSMLRSRDRTRAVLNAAADGVFTVSLAGRIEIANPAALLMFGCTPDQMIGERVDRFVSVEGFGGLNLPIPDDGGASQAVSDGCPAGYGVRRDGTEFPVEISVSSMKEEESESLIAVIRDISDRQSKEAQLRTLNRELEKHQEQFVEHEKMMSVGLMAAGVAHEIANPLANIDGLIQLIERNPSRLTAETPGQLREQVSRITQIVRQLKEFAHPMESDLQLISVDDLVQSAVGMIRFDMRHRQVSIEQRPANPCCSVLVHPQAIQQVLVNLIVNALDASVDKDSHRVVIDSSCHENGYCRISVQDNGTGISDEYLDRIFEPFFTTKPVGKGTGLGLSISYNLVEHNGGRIEVISEVGVGTCVSLIFPVAQCKC